LTLTKEGSIIQPKPHKTTSQSTNRVARRTGENTITGTIISGNQNKLVVIRKATSPSRPSSKTKHYVSKRDTAGRSRHNGAPIKPIIIPKLALQNINR
jgi:hypothetical protein